MIAEPPETEVSDIERLKAFLADAFRHEERWEIVANVATPNDFSFEFMQPEYHKFKFVMRNRQDGIDVCYKNRTLGEPRLNIRGEELNNPSTLGHGLFQMFSELASPLYERLKEQHRVDFNERLAAKAMGRHAQAPEGAEQAHSKCIFCRLQDWFNSR